MSTREAATVEPDGTHTDTEAAPDKRSIILVFVGLMITMLLASLDQMIFSTALPTIVGEFERRQPHGLGDDGIHPRLDRHDAGVRKTR